MSEVTTMDSLKDTFFMLLAEIRIEILAYLGTRHNLTPVTEASPCMLATYVENEMYIRLPDEPNGPVNWVARSEAEIQRHLQLLLKSEILTRWWGILSPLLNGVAILKDMEETVYGNSQ
ncbi:unnamed protein product [Fusarium equiseti]|uniref:Uncharacterized protein n=1 Tax=Fusarium equiseti TaxID=61235 RepID=A0A8J2NCG9_FUSEQ|nr:unnamed protein product [Fusarium equiseti]